MENSINRTATNANDMFVLHGVISNLTISNGTASFLNSFNKADVSHSNFYGVNAASRMVNEAMGDLDECEDVQHFGFMLSEQLITGAFPVAGFREGDKIAAVVTRTDGSNLNAHAVIRQIDGLLWMPLYANKGRYAVAFWIAKLLACCIFLCLLFSSPLFYFYPVFGTYWETLAKFAALFTGFSAILLVLTYFSSPEGAYAERIIKVLGFRYPRIVNLSKFSERSLRKNNTSYSGSLYVYDLVAALKAHHSLPKWHPSR